MPLARESGPAPADAPRNAEVKAASGGSVVSSISATAGGRYHEEKRTCAQKKAVQIIIRVISRQWSSASYSLEVRPVSPTPLSSK